MNKKAKILLTVVFSVLFVLFIAFVSMMGLFGSEPKGGTNVPDNGWLITKTDITIDVNKDRTANVVESYEVNFIEPSYSLYRALPLTQNERYYNIKGRVKGRTAYTTVETGLISNAGLNVVLVYIDLPSRMTGTCEFELSYKIIPKTQAGNTNRFYMNVVGFDWTTSQTNVSVTVNMPNEINKAETEVFMGEYGTTNQLLNGVTISGKTLSIQNVQLSAFSGITVDILLPKNSFTMYFDYYIFIALGVGIALLLMAYFVKRLFALNEPIVPIVNFYPPKEDGTELSPLDVGYLIDILTEPEDVTAMIYYFASKGFLLINAEDEKNIVLEKVRDITPKDLRPCEAEVFAAIFPAKSTTATLDSLKKTFPKAVISVTEKVKKRYEGKLKDKKFSAVTILATLLVFATSIIYPIVANLRICGGAMIMPIMLIVPFSFVYAMGYHICRLYHKLSETRRLVYFIVYGLFATGISVISAFLLGGAAMSFPERAVFLGFITAALMILPFLSKRTAYYTSRLNDITGFKNFLVTTEKDRLEMMLEENPNYYYDILPYANVLGVSDIWQNKFASITMPPPAYYTSSSRLGFNVVVFNSTFKSSTTTVSQTVRRINSAKSSSGGFSGGGSRGGFGGGGFGGGGGGRR